MILLDFHNKIIEDLLLDKLNNPPAADGKWESVDATIADFDGVIFHICSDAESRNLVTISISMKCFVELKKHGVDALLAQQYGPLLVSAEQGYDASVRVDLNNVADKEKTIRNVALLKRHCLSAPFYKVFAEVEAKKGDGQLIEIPYREEAFYLKQEQDRAIVIFAMQFKDADDVVFAKVFLQEYQDARKTINGVPSVTYSQKEPPLELKSVKNLRVGENNGFVSFVLFPQHIAGAKKEKTIDNIMTFRNYLHYHIKCSKAFLHTRMRNRVRTFLQILNRSKSDPATSEKKTITGRSFKRSDDPQKEENEFNI